MVEEGEEKEEVKLWLFCFDWGSAIFSEPGMKLTSRRLNGPFWQLCPFEWLHELLSERLDEAIKIPIGDASMCIVK